LDALVEAGSRLGEPITIEDSAVRQGLGNVRWPGRLELLDGARLRVGRILLDGAHNPAGAAALARALGELKVHCMPLVFGAMTGKRVHRVLRALAPLDPRPVFTAVDEAGARGPAELLDIWRSVGGGGGRTAATPREAVRMAGSLVRHDEPVVVAGSLYLVGAVRAMLAGDET